MYDIFAALADPNRRHIVELIAKNGQLSASDISSQFKISAPAISQHLKVLRESRLLEMERKAQQRIYTINPAAVSEVENWLKKLTEYWEDRFSRLDKILENEKSKLKKEGR